MPAADEIPRLLVAGRTERSDGDLRIELPRSAVDDGSIVPGEAYRIGLFHALPDGSLSDQDEPAPDPPKPPVEEGELRFVEIEDRGDRGDGIAIVERGYVLMIPGTTVGDRVRIEIQSVTPNFALAQVVDGPA